MWLIGMRGSGRWRGKVRISWPNVSNLWSRRICNINKPNSIRLNSVSSKLICSEKKDNSSIVRKM